MSTRRTKPQICTRLRGLVFLLLLGALIWGPQPALEVQAASTDVPCNVADLIAAINAANDNGVADTINLAAGCVYTLTKADNDTDGPNGLPLITSEITINGNGAILERDGGPNLRILYVAEAGNLALNNVTVRGGQQESAAGGGIWNDGTLTVTESTIMGNEAKDGGGIYNLGTLTVVDSTISSNETPFNDEDGDGGGIHNAHKLTVINSTLSNNWAANGGGLYNGGEAELTHATLSTNGIVSADSPWGLYWPMGDGAGIYNSSSLQLRNTIIAQQAAKEDCAGDPVLSDGYNLDSDGTCNLDAASDLSNAVPLLGPLQDNGGPTETHAPQTGSPAIDQGSCPDVTLDQRGVGRPIDLPGVENADDGCDIGAVEADWPMAVLSTTRLYAMLDLDETSAQDLTVSNVGSTSLDYELVVPDGISWLFVDPATGTIPPADSAPIQITFDPTGLAPGVYRTQLEVQTSDPTVPVLYVAADLFAGVVWNEVGCDVDHLLAALDWANANGVSDTLHLAPECVYTLTEVDNEAGTVADREDGNGLPTIAGEVTIQGNAAIVERDAAAPRFRILHVATSGNLTIHNLTIRGGALGEGDYVGCPDGGAGVGIANYGSLALFDSTIAEHVGGCNASNVGIHNAASGTAILTNSTVRDNMGYAIHNPGIGNEGTMTLTGCTVSGNLAGTGYGGGGIANGGTLTVINSTISGNESYEAAGIGNGGTLTLLNSTITDNTTWSNWEEEVCSGLCNVGTVTIRNTIVANQALGTDCGPAEAAGTITSLGHNLDSDGTCGLSLPTDKPNAAAMLGPLQDNGGPTQTHAPAGSAVIDQGSCPGVTTDQRGLPRPVDLPGTSNADDGCDIGAVELQRPSGGYLVGINVLHKNRKVLPDWRVTVYAGPDGTGGVWMEEATDENGRVVARLPNGSYSYKVTHGCYESGFVNFQVNGARVALSHRAVVPLTIRVVDSAERAMPGYVVRLYKGEGELVWWQTTPESGEVTFHLDADQEHAYVVEHNRIPGFENQHRTCEPAEAEYTLAKVQFHVQDAGGTPQSGWNVRVYRPGGTLTMYGYTGANGIATMYLVGGEFQYHVFKRGLISEPQSFWVVPGEDQTIEHILD